MRIDVLSFGTNDPQNALKITNLLHKILDEHNIDTSHQELLKNLNKTIKPGDCDTHLTFESTSDKVNNSVVVIYPLHSEFSLSNWCDLKLYTAHISEKFFDQLRTQRQFGYICSQSMMVMPEIASIAFLVQSEKPIDEIKFAIEEFSQNSVQILKEMNDQEWQKCIDAETKALLAEANSLKTDFSELHSTWFLSKRNLTQENFKRRQNLMDSLEIFNRQKFINLLDENILDAQSKRMIVIDCRKSTN